MTEKECIICSGIVELEEYKLLASEFKPYPAHAECFDTFTNADEFLKFAVDYKKISEPSKSPSYSSQDISPI